jgi:hypothetical protein
MVADGTTRDAADFAADLGVMHLALCVCASWLSRLVASGADVSVVGCVRASLVAARRAQNHSGLLR